MVDAAAWWCWLADRTCDVPLETTNASQEVAVDDKSSPAGTLRRHPVHRDRTAAFVFIEHSLPLAKTRCFWLQWLLLAIGNAVCDGRAGQEEEGARSTRRGSL